MYNVLIYTDTYIKACSNIENYIKFHVSLIDNIENYYL